MRCKVKKIFFFFVLICLNGVENYEKMNSNDGNEILK